MVVSLAGCDTLLDIPDHPMLHATALRAGETPELIAEVRVQVASGAITYTSLVPAR